MAPKMVQAVAQQVFPHLGRGYVRRGIYPVWYDESVGVWRICKESGTAPRHLTTEEAKTCLKTLRKKDGTPVYYSESEAERIYKGWRFELTR